MRTPPSLWTTRLRAGAVASALLALSLLGTSDAHARTPRRDRQTEQAEQTPAPTTPEGVRPPSVGAPVEVLPDATPPEAGASDLWGWVSRLDGEIPSPEAVAENEERKEEHLAESALLARQALVDVPTDFYEDPAGELHVDPLRFDEVDLASFDIPIELNDDVAKWIRYFTGPGRKYYTKWMGRSSRYRPMMYEKLEAAGLPRDLVYLSMIESGYSPHAYSVADAAGLWQFIPSTGKMYKLRLDYWVDERRDPALATDASIALLRDLHRMFDGDWRLAWAAYNAGPGRVRKAMTSSGSKDFFTIAHKGLLRDETANYVPKIMAAAIIGHNPERYGFTGIDFQPELRYDVAHVDGSVSLEALAKCAGVSLEVFQELNPALRRYATPPEGYDVRVPAGGRAEFLAKLDDIPRSATVASATQHRVQRGETLATIAAKYHTSASAIAGANHLRDADVIQVGTTLTIPGGERGEVVAVARADRPEGHAMVASSGSRSTTSRAAGTASATVVPKYHTVRSGDTLSEIAERYGTTTTQIRTWNGLKGSTIYSGQRLKVGTTTKAGETVVTPSRSAGTASAPASSRTGTSAASTSKITYTVKRGETLSGIAAKYGVSTADLQKWNGIRNASDIQAGQTLTIHRGTSGSSGIASSASSAPTWTKYTVRSGDNLTEIASRHGVTVAQIKEWNGLSSSTIHPGQTLKIKK